MKNFTHDHSLQCLSAKKHLLGLEDHSFKPKEITCSFEITFLLLDELDELTLCFGFGIAFVQGCHITFGLTHCYDNM